MSFLMRLLATMGIAGLFAAATVAPVSGYERPSQGWRVDVPADGSELRYPPVCGAVCMYSTPTLSADGAFTVFHSGGSNLVEGDTNEMTDVFVRSNASGKIERVSVASNGSQAVGVKPEVSTGGASVENLSIDGSLSASGRYVSFTSGAVNLVPGDVNAAPDIFVRDRKKGTTTMVSVSSEGEQAISPSGSYWSAISGNGRYVAFTSSAWNLTDEETCLVPQVMCASQFVYRHDMKTKKTELVSVTTSGGKAQGAFPSMSHDGRYVVFKSSSNELTDEAELDQNSDVYVRDMRSGETKRVSTPPDEPPMYPPDQLKGSSVHSYNPTISADGRFVAFESWASNLVPNDTNGTFGARNVDVDVFVKDMKTGRIERSNVTSAGEEVGKPLENPLLMGASGYHAAISSDGRYVVFDSSATELKDGDEPPVSLSFVHDRMTGATTRIDDGSAGGCEGRGAVRPGVAGGGRYVVALAWGCGPSMHGVVIDRGDLVGAAVVHRASSMGMEAGRGSVTKAAVTGVPNRTLREGRVAYRSETSDVMVRLDLEKLGSVVAEASDPTALFGARFSVDDAAYEVRIQRTVAGAASPGGAEFGLFRCSGTGRSCTHISPLKGGYGTVGDAVVVAIPNAAVGLPAGDRLQDLEVFSALGSFRRGVVEIVDELGFSK